MRTTWIRFQIAGAALGLLVTAAQAQSFLAPGGQQRHSNQDNGGPVDEPLANPSTATNSGQPGRPWVGLANRGGPTLGDPAYENLFDAIFTESRRSPRDLPIRVDLESHLLAGERPEASRALGPPNPGSAVVVRPVRTYRDGLEVNSARGGARVPEPASILALGLGLALLVPRRRQIR